MIRPVFLHYNQDLDLYIITIPQYWFWHNANTGWMANDNIGPSGKVPDIDTIEKQEIFFTQEPALKRLAELYAEQLKT